MEAEGKNGKSVEFTYRVSADGSKLLVKIGKSQFETEFNDLDAVKEFIKNNVDG